MNARASRSQAQTLSSATSRRIRLSSLASASSSFSRRFSSSNPRTKIFAHLFTAPTILEMGLPL